MLEGWDTGPLDQLETDLYRWSVGEQTSPLVIFTKAVKGFEFFKIDFELCCYDLSGTVMELLLGQRKSGPQQLQTSIDNLAVEVKQVALAKYKSDLQNCVCNFFKIMFATPSYPGVHHHSRVELCVSSRGSQLGNCGVEKVYIISTQNLPSLSNCIGPRYDH